MQKRVRSADTHADDVVNVLKSAKRAEGMDPAKKDPLPLPGLRLGQRKFGRDYDGVPHDLAAHDKKERDKWSQRLTKILLESGAPVVEGMTEIDARAVVEMAVGRSRPSTVRLRIRSWEAFTQWMRMSRGRTWPS